MRKTHFLILIAVTLLFVFSSCATTNPDGSPKWTTHVPQSWRTYYATGYGKLSNVTNSRIRAESAAIDDIARWASVTVHTAVTNYTNDVGFEHTEVLEVFSHQVVDISLRGVVIEKSYIDKDGGVWVLASFSTKHLKEAYKEQVKKLEQQQNITQAEKMIHYLEVLLDKEAFQ